MLVQVKVDRLSTDPQNFVIDTARFAFEEGRNLFQCLEEEKLEGLNIRSEQELNFILDSLEQASMIFLQKPLYKITRVLYVLLSLSISYISVSFIIRDDILESNQERVIILLSSLGLIGLLFCRLSLYRSNIAQREVEFERQISEFNRSMLSHGLRLNCLDRGGMLVLQFLQSRETRNPTRSIVSLRNINIETEATGVTSLL